MDYRPIMMSIWRFSPSKLSSPHAGLNWRPFYIDLMPDLPQRGEPANPFLPKDIAIASERDLGRKQSPPLSVEVPRRYWLQ